MDALAVRAIRANQGGSEVFAFFIEGSRLLEIAELSRITAKTSGGIEGFQRPEIRSHVRDIAEYLEKGPGLFPNAIIIALAPGARFTAARGTKPDGLERAAPTAGTLRIPVRPGRKAGWIVDGQQRTLALAETAGAGIVVPVVAFVSADISVHREQFILVNKARPLSRRLIDELLPEVGSLLPRDLAARKVPSTLCRLMNEASDSPLLGLIRRPSQDADGAVMLDSSLIRAIKRSIQDPRGALAAHISPNGAADLEAMYAVMQDFWAAVRDAFPEAWGRSPEKSRLMHAAGVEAMGILMDQIMTRSDCARGGYAVAKWILTSIAPNCRWTSGTWEPIGRQWNDIQCTRKDIRTLSNLLVSLEREVGAAAAA
jgi:DGQHR domain-containing protein